MVHNNIRGAKGAFLGGPHWNGTVLEGSLGDGVVPTGRWVRSVGGVGGVGCGGWRRAVSFTVSLSRGVSFAPEYAHRFFGRNVMLPPL